MLTMTAWRTGAACGEDRCEGDPARDTFRVAVLCGALVAATGPMGPTSAAHATMVAVTTTKRQLTPGIVHELSAAVEPRRERVGSRLRSRDVPALRDGESLPCNRHRAGSRSAAFVPVH